MLRLAADENLHRGIVRGVRRRLPAADFVRVQDHGLSGAADPGVLAWTAGQGRILVTHDVTTMTKHARARLARGDRMPGVLQVPRRVPLAAVIDEIVLIIECSSDVEWDGQVHYLPL